MPETTFDRLNGIAGSLETSAQQVRQIVATMAGVSLSREARAALNGATRARSRTRGRTRARTAARKAATTAARTAAKATPRARRRKGEQMTRWIANNAARRVPNFVIKATGLDTKKKIVARYGPNARFEMGKPLPKAIAGGARATPQLVGKKAATTKKTASKAATPQRKAAAA